VRGGAGGLVLSRALLAEAPADLRNRLLAQALIFVSGAEYRPRYQSLADLWTRIGQDKRHTLMGCLILPRKAELWVLREPAAALAAPAVAVGQVWDGRWHVSGPQGEVRALGEAGLAECPDWRATGLPRPALLSSPALWQGARLIAAPLAGKTAGSRAEPIKSDDDFFNSLILH
ncbi:MAG: tRNA(Ile)-lysidine synthetase, partial [Rhodobacteraceae bacterium]|nr:tRNA(Ile)-lysidine synthetase [Paracoccaceae bacterium]